MTVIAELRMRPRAEGATGWDAPRAVRLALSGAVLFLLLVAANLATPLYRDFEARLGYGSLGTALAFSCYVLALVGVLVTAGHWSDHVGRRAAMVLAVLLGIAGGGVFAAAGSLAQLCAGRALQGLAVGLATGACAAALRELLPGRPAWASRFTLLASSGGVALGPVLGGALSLAPGGAAVPFEAVVGALAVLLVPLLAVRARPAPLVPADPRPVRALAPRSLRGALPAGPARPGFWLAAGIGFLSFALFGYQLAFSPAVFERVLGVSSAPLLGGAAALTLAASAASQLAVPPARGRAAAAELPLALAALAGAVAVLAGATAAGDAVGLAAASVLAGIGQGVAFRAAFDRVAGSVAPEQHARTVSLLYVVTYLGSALPVLGLGALAAAVGLSAAGLGFLGACALAAAALAAAAPRIGRRSAGGGV
jgi:MFS family permease